jgi:hypothetical protein
MDEGAAGPFSPILKPVTQRSREREDDDDDDKYGYHQPDRISVGELRQDIKDELEKHEGERGMVVSGSGSGIADADGLGWPGTSKWETWATMQLIV